MIKFKNIHGENFNWDLEDMFVTTKNISVENAIVYRFTNGLAEGSVNKLKTLKRTMYGKASFETLRRKLLWYEKNK